MEQNTGKYEGEIQAEEVKPIGTLLGAITYTDRKDYENFLSNLTLEHAVIVLISAATYAQGKGLFSLDEAELIAKSIKRVTTKPQDEEAAPETPQTSEKE